MLSKTTGRVLSIMIALLVFAGTVGVGFSLGFRYVLSQNDRFANFSTQVSAIGIDTPGAIMVVIRQGFDTSDIAAALKDAGAIKNELAFVFMSKLNGFDGEYTAGTHFVKGDMNYDEIMYS